jgi:transposase
VDLRFYATASRVLVWDNVNTHVSAAMAELIAARPWLTVYRLPPYAHELNPVEPVWAHLKRSLANLTKHTIAELTALVKTRLSLDPPRRCFTLLTESMILVAG